MWQPQVQILLQLKKQLAEASAAKTEKVEPAQNGENVEDAATIEAAITKQGLLVRDLKAKGDKSVWQPQVEILLNLKKRLASITGVQAASTNDKKSKKKK